MTELMPEEVIELQKQYEDLKAEKELLEEENKNLSNQVAELKEELQATQEKVPAENEKFEYNGKQYEILVKDAFIPGVSEAKLTALEIANCQPAKEKLVKINSGIIREIL